MITDLLFINNSSISTKSDLDTPLWRKIVQKVQAFFHPPLDPMKSYVKMQVSKHIDNEAFIKKCSLDLPLWVKIAEKIQGIIDYFSSNLSQKKPEPEPNVFQHVTNEEFEESFHKKGYIKTDFVGIGTSSFVMRNKDNSVTKITHKKSNEVYRSTLHEARLIYKIPPEVPHIFKVQHCLFSDQSVAVTFDSAPNTISADKAWGKIPLKTLKKYIKHWLETLAGLHKEGLIHTDTKPENLIIQEGTENSWVIDFGKSFSEGYCSPETNREHGPSDNKANMFAFGMTICEIFIGKRFIYLDSQNMQCEYTSLHKFFYQDPEWKYEILFKTGILQRDDLDIKNPEWKEWNDPKCNDSPYLRNPKEVFRVKEERGQKIEHEDLDDVLNFITFIERMLQPDPKKRPTAQALLNHPWMK